MNTYRTSQAAEIIGVHPNTVRLYEDLNLIPKAERKENGYRVFTDFHLDVFRLARTAFQIEVLQGGLRKKIVQMVKTTAAGDLDAALILIAEYLELVRQEQLNAKEAITVTEKILSGEHAATDMQLKRADAAKYLQVTVDTLRNWELNGLLSVKRRENGYRVYTGEDIDRLKIIRSLRCANYSLEAILRMLLTLSHDPQADVEAALESPDSGDDIVSVCDKLLTSLHIAEENAVSIQQMLFDMKVKY